MVSFTVIIASIAISIIVTVCITLCCRLCSDYIETFIISIPESLSENITKLRDTEGKIRAMNNMERNDWVLKVESTLEKARQLLRREYSSSTHNNAGRRPYFCFGHYDCRPIKLKREVKHLIVEGEGIIAARAKAANTPDMEEGTASFRETVEQTCHVLDIERGATSLELTGEQICPSIEVGSTVDETLDQGIVHIPGVPSGGESTSKSRPLELQHTGGVSDIEEGKKSIKQGPTRSKNDSTNSSYKLPLPLCFGSRNSSSANDGDSSGSNDMGDTRTNANLEVPPTGRVTRTPNLRIYTFAELRSVTRNFELDTTMDVDRFERVFKGWVDEKTYAPSEVGIGIPVAVKRYYLYGVLGLQDWQAVLELWGKFSHPNLVKLLGYCWEDSQFLLLVYEYMQKGSLKKHFFRNGAEPLSWEIRLKIAIGAARGLAFLHNSEKSVIYRDFSASNILLDQEFNAKLSDFGLPSPVDIDGRVGGVAAPAYKATGHLSIKSDVYGFGVVLLELLTGRFAGLVELVDFAKPLLSDKRTRKKLMDPRLENQYPSKAAWHLAELTLSCLDGDPKNRPSMEEVLGTLERVYLIKGKRKKAEESKDKRVFDKVGKCRDVHNTVRSGSHPEPSQIKNYGSIKNRI